LGAGYSAEKVVLIRAEAEYEKGKALLWNFAEKAARKGWICDGILCGGCCWGPCMKWYTRVSVPRSPYMVFLMHSLQGLAQMGRTLTIAIAGMGSPGVGMSPASTI